MKTDFIVIGSGLAGLTSALVLQKHGQVLLVSKGKLKDCATNLAQGGICCVAEKDDSFKSHIKDTLVAGAYHNDQKAVEYVVKHAPSAIDWLVAQGVHFEKKNGQFSPTKEAAHSHARVLHATDFTGEEIEKALMAKVRSAKNITIWENCFAMDLLVNRGKCFGVKVLKGEKIISLFAKLVVLATGGLGQLYLWTTNPQVATGDGIAMGKRAGAQISDLEFIQFHPTAFKQGQSPLFLLTEALRGEGAFLVKGKGFTLKVHFRTSLQCEHPEGERGKGKGERFMGEYDKRLELAPRDIVARAIIAEQEKGSGVFLDIRHRGEEFLKSRFPNIYKRLKEAGYDLAKDLIPVTPAAHYLCGGIKVDLFGRTNVKNLFAFGEVACSGAQGANRLASNSLLEAVVFPLRLKDCVKELFCHSDPDVTSGEESLLSSNYQLVDPSTRPSLAGSLRMTEIRMSLQKLMWEKVGIIRTRSGMEEALEKIKEWERELFSLKGINQELLELKNMILVARLVAEAALKRKESLGAHFVEE